MSEKLFWELVRDKREEEIKKSMVRSIFAPQIAEPLCAAIDSQGKVELLNKLYREWIEHQKRQYDIINAFCRNNEM